MYFITIKYVFKKQTGKRHIMNNGAKIRMMADLLEIIQGSGVPSLKFWKKSVNLEFYNMQKHLSKMKAGAFLVAQGLRIRLPIRGTRVWALVREDPTCHGATKPVRHNYWAYALEPRATTTESACLEPMLRNKEKPPQWEACAPQRRLAPTRRN